MRIFHAAILAALLPCAGPAFAQPAPLPPGLTLQTLNPTQSLPGAVGVRHANDGSNRLFVIARAGQIRIMSTSGVVQATPFLSFQANPPPLGFFNVDPVGQDERGLLGLAFHPLYASNGKFYVYYMDTRSDSVVTEYTVSAMNPNLADPLTARVILRVYQPYANHNGGDIHFGADGYLYVGLGDGGSGNDPCNSGQSLTSAQMSNTSPCVATSDFTGTPPTGSPRGQATSRALLGKMLRIDVDSTDTPVGADLCGADTAVRRYGIPADNPFAGDTGSDADACDEIYHYGLRNPYRFSFDRDTSDLIIGDVGQSAFEEVDLVSGAGGHNFGWKICEGFNQRGSTSIDCPLASATDPILAYGRGLGGSLTGGFRYRGPYLALQGVYFYADASSGRVFFARENAGSWAGTTWLTQQGPVVGFGEDEAGHLYLTTLDGVIKRFTLPQGNLDVSKLATLSVDTGQAGVGDVGDVVSYAVTVRNSGTEPVTGLVVMDTFGTNTPQTLSCTPSATLAAGAVSTCTVYTRTVTQDDVDAGADLINVAQAVAQTAAVGEVTDSATATVSMVPKRAEMLVTVDANLADTDSSGAASAGEVITYTFTVQNSGNVRLSAVALTTTRTGPRTCAPTALDPGASADCGTATYVVTQGDVDAQEAVVNGADASALAPGAVAVEGAGQAVTAVDEPAAEPALLLTSVLSLSNDVDGDGAVDAGDSVTHAYTVENSGDVALADVTVDSSLHGSAACVLGGIAPGQTAACSVTYVATPADMSASVLVDTATAQATHAGAPVVSPAVLTQIVVDRPDAIFRDGFEAD